MKAIAGVAALMMAACSDSENVVLDAREWQCHRTEVRITLVPMMTGNRTNLLPFPREVCVEYRRKGER